MDRIETLLHDATRQLAEAGLPEPRRDAELLLAQALHRDRTFLLAHPEAAVSPEQSVGFRQAVERRTAHYPIQYLLGRQEFFGRSFRVDERVLIPRPETELLIEIALALLTGAAAPQVADIGTGSGCIAATLACERSDCSVVATDRSSGALELARDNALRLGVADRIDFRLGSILEPVRAGAAFDLIAANPPYVADGDPRVTPEVALYEPREAVFSGVTGLELQEAILRQCASFLKPGRSLVLEIGAGQRASVIELGTTYGWRCSAVRRDLAGIERCLVFRRD